MVSRASQVIPDIFNEVQGVRTSRKNVILMRQHLVNSDVEDFTRGFLSCLNRALVCRKSDTNADRVLKFVAHFISLLESSDADETESFGEVTTLLIQHLLRGVESKEKHVRYRVCQLFALLMSSGMSEIEEDLFEAVQSALIKRVRDRESNVRVQAVIALARFQAPPELEEDEDESEDESASKVTEILLHLLSHDPSAEVRRAVLHNLSQSGATLPFLLERARDLDPVVRRQIYSTIMPSINGFKPLSISKRNKLLRWGLRDRDETVRKAAQRMFAIDWLNLANGSILELLQRLDIVNSTVGEDVMTAFFEIRREFISQLSFDEAFWAELNPESIFLVRCLNDFALNEGISDVVSEKLPELSTLSDLIVKHVALAGAQADNEKADTEFVLGNLLKLAMRSDLSDEIGRRRLLSNCQGILRSGLSENLLILSVEVLSKGTLSEHELTQTVREIITDLYDTLEDEKEANESFHSASSDLTQRGRSATPTADSEAIQIKYIFTTLRALTIIGALLQHIGGNLKTNPGLDDILQDIIVPAYRSHEGPICEKGIECLGQICLLDRDLAQSYLGHFLNCFAKGYEDLKILALKCVTDILMAHPTMLIEDNIKREAGDEDSEAAKELGGESSSLEDDLVRIYLKAFQYQDLPEVVAMATQSVSKLLLFNILMPESRNARGLLKEMALLYYHPENADNQSMRQNLAYFFPVYSFSSLEHQNAMSSIVVSTIKKIARLYESLDASDKSDAVALLSIGNQLIDWTNPERLVQSDADKSGQVELIEPMVKRIISCEKEESRVLASALNKIHIPRDADIETLQELATQAVEDCHDIISKRSIIKFKTHLEKLALMAEDPEGAEEGGNETVGDETIMSVAESIATVSLDD